MVVDGYWADRTRPVVAGSPTGEQLRVCEVVRKANAAASTVLRPGRTGPEIDAAARAVIEEAGYGCAFPHVTGHGLGFGYHESAPLLSPSSRDVLELRVLTSIEPGVCFEPMGGIRIEDDVLVTGNGCEVPGLFPEFIGRT